MYAKQQDTAMENPKAEHGPWMKPLSKVPRNRRTCITSVHIVSCCGRSLDTVPLMSPSRSSLTSMSLWPNHLGSPCKKSSYHANMIWFLSFTYTFETLTSCCFLKNPYHKSVSILVIVSHPHFLMGSYHLLSTAVQNKTITVCFQWFIFFRLKMVTVSL